MKNTRRNSNFLDEDFEETSRKEKMKDKMRRRAKREKNMMRSKNLNPNDIIDFYEDYYERDF